MTRLRLPVVTLTLLIGSTAWADLRTYEVAPQYREEIYNALRRVLEPQGQPTQGRVELLPTGQILVNASAETLEQVAQVLQAIGSRSAPATPRVVLRYWGVLGTRPGDTTANAVGSAPPPALADVLDELTRLHGELAFRVLGGAAVMTNSGQRGEVEGATLSVEQTAHVQGDTLSAEISLQLMGIAPPPIGVFNGGEIDLRATLRRGEFVVLGESYFQSGAIEPGPEPIVQGPVFYIVHWEE